MEFEKCLLYVGTEDGIRVLSVDPKHKVRFAAVGLQGNAVRAIAVHPENPEIAYIGCGLTFDQTDSKRIYAGIEQGGLIYTHNGGQTWYEALIGYDLHRIGVSIADPNYILAGAGEGLFASKDAGKSWESIPALQGKYIHSIVSSPDNHKRWYVYADDSLCPIYRSDDNGETWKSIGKGLPSSQPADNLVIHPITPNVLFYAGDTQFRKSALLLSTDSGENWKCILEDLPKVWRVRIVITNDGT